MIGVLAAAAIAYGMYAGAIRINLAKFFKYTGIFLIVVAAGILSYGIGALQTVGWLPGLSAKAFDISTWFNWSSWYGEIIQGVFNITPTPTVLQLAAWLAYLVIVLTILPAPDEGARETRSITATPTRIRKVDYVKLHSSDRRRRRCAGGSGTDQLPGQGDREDRRGNRATSAPAEITVDASDTACELSGTEADTGAEHLRRSPTTAPRSPSSTSTARASG